LRDVEDAIRDRGATLWVVGNGTPAHARDFQAERGAGLNLLVDPALEAYRAAGLRRGALRTLAPRSLGHGLRALAGGNVQGATRGDPWQLGGAFVVDRSGRVHYAQVSSEAGDHAEPDDILAALDRLRKTESRRR
jgi:peroxiredoxin